MKIFSELIRIKRRELRYSQRELAELCGLTRGIIMHIENKKQQASLEQAIQLAKVLKINLNKVVAK